MRARLPWMVGLALLAACEGGDVRSRSPIVDDEMGVADPRLAGAWEAYETRSDGRRSEEPSALLLVGSAAREEPTFLATWALQNGAGETDAVVAGELAGRRYLSIRRVQPPDADSLAQANFHVLRCDWYGDDTLHLFRFSPKLVQAAIEAGALRGRIVGDKYVRITASTDELAAWVTRQDPAEVFIPYLVLHRMRSSAPPASEERSRPAAARE